MSTRQLGSGLNCPVLIGPGTGTDGPLRGVRGRTDHHDEVATDHRHYQFANFAVTLRSESIDDGLSAVEFVGRAGAELPTMSDDLSGLAIQVCHGSVWYRNGDRDGVGRAGTTLLVRRGALHTLRVVSPQARLARIASHHGMEQLIAATGQRALSTEPPTVTSVDVEPLRRDAATQGITIIDTAPFLRPTDQQSVLLAL